MTDPRNFLLNTDYPLDKIVYMTSGTVPANGTSQTTATITHGLGFMPLPVIQWSFTSNFAECYEETHRPSEFTPITFPYTCDLTADDTTITIDLARQYTTGNMPTVYYRIICFIPDGVSADVASLSNLADNFIINTDYNYTKLYLVGSTLEGTSITHNLGYVPQVLTWVEVGDKITNVTHYGVGFPFVGTPYVTTTQLVMPDAGILSGPGTYHYRIYIDE